MEIEEHIKCFEDNLRRGKWGHSSIIANQTVKLLEKIISQSEWQNAKELLDLTKERGKQLTEAHPSQTVVGNMIKRVLKIIREEYFSGLGNQDNAVPEPLPNMLITDGKIDYAKPMSTLKESIEDSLRELLVEMETSLDNIASQSLEHIHSDDIIMTAGKSRTVEKFLKKASTKRKFQVIVVEGAPFYHGHELAKNLAQHGIETTLIHDSAMFAIMSRVNKVIIGTYSVMANGGLRAACGTHTLALAAKHQSVPLIVCTPMFKFTPRYIRSADQVFFQEWFNHLMSPQDVLTYEEDSIRQVQVLNPVFDYVPPELVTLLVSNIGGNSPSYVYRLLSELYHEEDYEN